MLRPIAFVNNNGYSTLTSTAPFLVVVHPHRYLLLESTMCFSRSTRESNDLGLGKKNPDKPIGLYTRTKD